MPTASPEWDAEVWRRYSRGRRQHDIARELDVAQSSISAAVNRHRATIPPEAREELLQSEMDFHQRVRDEVLEVFYAKPAPVTAGKDGQIVHDPITGEVVEDHTGRIAALRCAQDISRHIAKLAGLEAPTRLDITATEQAATEQAAMEAATFVAGGRDDSR
jgi:hypothetical protein